MAGECDWKGFFNQLEKCTTCPVCLEVGPKTGKPIYAMSCHHMMCFPCLETMSRRTCPNVMSCPVCRKELSIGDVLLDMTHQVSSLMAPLAPMLCERGKAHGCWVPDRPTPAHWVLYAVDGIMKEGKMSETDPQTYKKELMARHRRNVEQASRALATVGESMELLRQEGFLEPRVIRETAQRLGDLALADRINPAAEARAAQALDSRPLTSEQRRELRTFISHMKAARREQQRLEDVRHWGGDLRPGQIPGLLQEYYRDAQSGWPENDPEVPAASVMRNL